jgi:hypothetical protein
MDCGHGGIIELRPGITKVFVGGEGEDGIDKGLILNFKPIWFQQSPFVLVQGHITFIGPEIVKNG